MASRDKRPPKTFLDLPPELRNRIYDLSGCLILVSCLSCGGVTTCDRFEVPQWESIHHHSCTSSNFAVQSYGYELGSEVTLSTSSDSRNKKRLFYCYVGQPELTKVCRRIRNETLPMFYGGNVFRTVAYLPYGGVNILSPTQNYFKSIGKVNTGMLRKVIVHVTEETCNKANKRQLSRKLEEMGVQVNETVVEFYKDRTLY